MGYRADDLIRLIHGDHTDAVRALEDDTTDGLTGRLDAALDALARRTLTAWVQAFGGPDTQATPGTALTRLLAAVRAAVRRLLDPLGERAHQAITAALTPAVRLGATQAAQFLRAAGSRRATTPRVRADRAMRAEAARIVGIVADRRDRALTLLGRSQVTRWSHLLHAIGAARTAVAAVRAHASWTIAQAVNTGLNAAADTRGLVRLWVAEAGACVRCLAYTGRTEDAHGHFPGGLAWDPRSRAIGAPAIDGPPLHPHCRCRTVPWNPRLRPAAGSIPFPLALQREAHRTIAYGAGDGSRASRLRAARELLRTEPDLLPAVEARARTALRTSRFPAAA